MQCINSLILEGKVARVGELEKRGEMDYAEIEVCIERANGEVSYFPIECYGMVAEKTVQYTQVDKGVRVVGRLVQRKWSDLEGTAHSYTAIVAEHIEWKFGE